MLNVVAALTAMAALGACKPSPQQVADGDDPLAALAVTAESHRYNSGYWHEQAHADSAGRWARAVAYCGDVTPRPGLEADGAKPNCVAVQVAAFEEHQARSAAQYRARDQAAEARRERLRRDPAEAKRVADSAFRAMLP